jgi:hypothetical protein
VGYTSSPPSTSTSPRRVAYRVPPLAHRLEDRLRGRVGDGVHRVPPIAGIGDVVDPDLIAAALGIGERAIETVGVVHRVVVVRRLARRHRLDEARVRALSHDEPRQRLRAGPEKLRGIEPSHHGEALDAGVRPPEQRKSAARTRQASRDRERLALAR